MQPRVLQRARDGRNRTRIGTLNCRMLLANERMLELDAALTAKVWAFALRKRRDMMDLCSGKGGVGITVHKRFHHLIS